jgi:hypothetical protein
MIASTRPTRPHRWIPFVNSPSLPFQPPLFVQLSHTGAFEEFGAYLCYTHVLRVKPLLRRAEKPEGNILG